MNEFEQIHQMLTKKIKELDQLKVKAERSLKKAPEGSLVLSKSNGVVQYFHKTESKEKKGKYIEKNNQKLIRGLAQKDYDQRFLKEIDKQRNQIAKIMKNLPDKSLKDIFSFLSMQRKELVVPHVLTDEQYIQRWLNTEYKGKDYAGELPMHITDRGERVRSKSEKMIADKLYSMGVPYRYEYPLNLKGFGVVYPDFTMLNISTSSKKW